MSNLREIVVGVLQQIFAFPDPPLNQIVDGGDAVLLLEGMGQIILVHVVRFAS